MLQNIAAMGIVYSSPQGRMELAFSAVLVSKPEELHMLCPRPMLWQCLATATDIQGSKGDGGCQLCMDDGAIFIRTLGGTGSFRDKDRLLRGELEGEPWFSMSARRRCGLYITEVTYLDLYLHTYH